jgi:hypothetical protein
MYRGKPPPSRLPLTRPLRRALLGLALLGLAGCASSGYTYIANDGLGTYFRVPSDYEVFDTEQVLAPALEGLPEGQAEAVLAQQWAVAFDGGDDPAPDRFLSQLLAPADAVAGYARVRTLSAEERLTYSLQSLRNELLRREQEAQLGDRLKVLDVQEIEQEGGDGLKLTFSVDGPGGTFVFDQLGLVDDRTSRVFLLALGCSAACYDDNRDAIAAIAESWTIEER